MADLMEVDAVSKRAQQGGSTSPSKRRRAEDAVEAAKVTPAASGAPLSSSALAQQFNPQLLRLYYSRLFPYNEMYRWLSYGHDPAKADKNAAIDPDFFSRREISFTLAGDVYIRYLCFKDQAEMRKEIMAKQPHKIDLGAVYNASPKGRSSIKNTSFECVEREFVIDIDLTDYDDIRTSAAGTGISRRCWQLMAAAIQVLDTALRVDFGFKAVLWVYSGRRGIHCHVCDKRARLMDDQARTAVAKYLAVVEGNEMSAKRVELTSPLHPSLERALDILRPLFENDIIQEHGQQLLSEPEYFPKLVKMLPDVPGLREEVEKEWGPRGKCIDATDRWEKLQEVLAKYLKRRNLTEQQRLDLVLCPQEMIFTCTYPRLDINVSTHRNHLLKSPFCAHPKTGRVCVPIDPATAEQFDPFAVPTLASLCEEINRFDAENPEQKGKPDVEKTSLQQYLVRFEKVFLTPLYSLVRAEFREHAERQAAHTNEW